MKKYIYKIGAFFLSCLFEVSQLPVMTGLALCRSLRWWLRIFGKMSKM